MHNVYKAYWTNTGNVGQQININFNSQFNFPFGYPHIIHRLDFGYMALANTEVESWFAMVTSLNVESNTLELPALDPVSFPGAFPGSNIGAIDILTHRAPTKDVYYPNARGVFLNVVRGRQSGNQSAGQARFYLTIFAEPMQPMGEAQEKDFKHLTNGVHR